MQINPEARKCLLKVYQSGIVERNLLESEFSKDLVQEMISTGSLKENPVNSAELMVTSLGAMISWRQNF